METTYLTCLEAGKIIGVGADMVRVYERTGKLPAIKSTTGIRLFRKQDVEKLVKKRLEWKAKKSKNRRE